jgi:hypothetical protein
MILVESATNDPDPGTDVQVLVARMGTVVFAILLSRTNRMMLRTIR